VASVSACLIVRDEAANLPGCLAALRPWVAETCVLDTGSRDGTPELASRLGARVEHAEWRDDFAAARNRSLAMATGDWILVVDADEELVAASGPALVRAVGDPRALAWLVRVESLDGRGGSTPADLPRLFRNGRGIRFSRAVHESVMDSLIALGAGTPRSSGLRLRHTGYLPEAVRARGKRERNLAILRRVRRQQPGDVYNLFKLAASLSAAGEREEALAAWEEAWSAGRALSAARRAERPFLARVAAGLVAALMGEGRMAAALEVAREGLGLFPRSAELSCAAGELARRTGRPDEARAHFERALGAPAPPPPELGDPDARSRLPLVGLARLALEGGGPDAPRALELAAAAGGPCARCLAVRWSLAAGDEDGAWRALDALLGADPQSADVQLLAAEMAFGRGELETALHFWRACSSGDGDGGQTARAWLAVVELAGGRLERAARHLARLRGSDPRGAAARLVLAAAAGVEAAPDPGFRPRALLPEVARWLEILSCDPDQRALGAFARAAQGLAARVPGIERLVVRE